MTHYVGCAVVSFQQCGSAHRRDDGEKEKDDDALEAFSLALGINPNYHYTYYEIGIIQEDREKYESALKNYEKFLEFDNTDSEVVEAKERVEELLKNN